MTSDAAAGEGREFGERDALVAGSFEERREGVEGAVSLEPGFDEGGRQHALHLRLGVERVRHAGVPGRFGRRHPVAPSEGGEHALERFEHPAHLEEDLGPSGRRNHEPLAGVGRHRTRRLGGSGAGDRPDEHGTEQDRALRSHHPSAASRSPVFLRIRML